MVNCSDCGSEHMGSNCGMSWAERVSSFQMGKGTRTFPRNYYDRAALEYSFGTPEEHEHELGSKSHLKWSKHREPYKWNAKDKSYEKADLKDVNRTLFGREETGRSISASIGRKPGKRSEGS